MLTSPRCRLLVLVSAILISAPLHAARAQTCSDYSRQLHWMSRTMLTGQFAHLALQGSYGYLTDEDSGLQILDFTDPLHPRYVRSFDLPGQPWDVCMRGSYACVSAFDQGLQIVDISDPVNPILTGSVWSSSAINLQVFGNFVYMADFFASRVYVIAISDPTNPEIVAEVQTQGWAWDVAISEPDKLMVVSATYSVAIVDISDPFSPRRKGSVPISDAVYEVGIEDHYAYVAGVAGFYVIDFDDPVHPAIVAQVPGSFETILVRDGFAFLGTRDNGVTVMDVRDPMNPLKAGHCYLQGWPFGFAASGDFLYAVDYWRDINVFRIEDSAAVPPLGFMATPSARLYVSIAEPYAYIADVVGGFLIADLSVPTSPRQIAQLDIAGHAWGVAYDNGYAYLACDTPGLRIVSVANPENPILVGSTATGGQASRVVVREGYAYVLGESNGLSIVDVQDPSNPQLVGALSAPGTDVELYGNLAYIATASGVKIVDIDDPTDPQLLSSVSVGFRPRSLAADEGHLFVGGDGEQFTGMFASLSLQDPTHPLIQDRIPTLRNVRDAERHGSYVWLAEDDAPVLIADVSRPDDLEIIGMIELSDYLDSTWDLAVGSRLAIGGNGGDHGRLAVLPCNLPITPYAGGGGHKPPATSRMSTLVCEPGATVRLGFNPGGRAAMVDIIDVSGRIVRRLAVEGGTAGPLGVTWDTKTAVGRIAAPGVYFARMAGEGRQEARRLIVVR